MLTRVSPLSSGASEIGVSYAEVRVWAVYLQIFTARDLADAMSVNVEVAERGIRALLWHGIFTNGGYIDGPDGPESVVEYVPIPPGPREHFTYPPEWRTCEQEILCPRGMPVRIRTERDQRVNMSTPGARQKMKNRERAYQRAQEAKERRAAANKIKAHRDPKWKRPKRSSVQVES